MFRVLGLLGLVNPPSPSLYDLLKAFITGLEGRSGRATCSRGPLSKPKLEVGRRLNPRNLRTHIFRLLGPKTILYKAFGLF